MTKRVYWREGLLETYEVFYVGGEEFQLIIIPEGAGLELERLGICRKAK